MTAWLVVFLVCNSDCLAASWNMSRNLLYHKPLLFLQMKATSVLKHLFCVELLVHLTFSLRLHLIPTNNYRAWDHSSDLGMLILYRTQTAASSHLPKTVRVRKSEKTVRDGQTNVQVWLHQLHVLLPGFQFLETVIFWIATGYVKVTSNWGSFIRLCPIKPLGDTL